MKMYAKWALFSLFRWTRDDKEKRRWKTWTKMSPSGYLHVAWLEFSGERHAMKNYDHDDDYKWRSRASWVKYVSRLGVEKVVADSTLQTPIISTNRIKSVLTHTRISHFEGEKTSTVIRRRHFYRLWGQLLFKNDYRHQSISRFF